MLDQGMTEPMGGILSGRTRHGWLAVASGLLAAACGGGGSSGASDVAVQINIPGAPLGLSATPGNASISLSFNPPASSGSSAVSSYSAFCTAGATTVSATGSSSPLAVSELSNGVTYSCSVSASNSFGAGPRSTAVSATPLGTLGTPGAPTLVSVTPGNTSAALRFDPPAASGGAPIVRYSAACVSGQATASVFGRSSPIVVLGLTNGGTYQCSVSASSSLGAGPSSRALNVVPNPSSSTPARVAEFTTVDFDTVTPYSRLDLPAYFDGTVFALDNTPPGNNVDDRIATLGRVLFYDKRLSRNDTVACASCHHQANGFSDPRRFSVGFDGASFTSAHSMALANVRFYRPGEMFWDRRSVSVENQASQPIINSIEMGWNDAAGGFGALIAKLEGLGYYSDLFSFAFGTPVISEARIGRALAQFERSLVSSSSRWDTGYATVFDAAAPNRNLGVDLPNLTVEENRGRQLFMTGRGQGGAGCSACHLPPSFSLAANSLSNGLDAGETRIFKSPSLKNVAMTAPYMHDGRFDTLEQVVDFYDRGIRLGPALDNRLRQGAGAQQLGLSPSDRAALVAFMKTLDDVELASDLRYSSPMKK
ncbi:MAG: hypothetical protein KGS00_09655 [Alphaproteobacteria bacterium]|nr:hypothetical protein [Alphaproteobacteria bacterium]